MTDELRAILAYEAEQAELEATRIRNDVIKAATEEVDRASKNTKAALDKLHRTHESLNFHQQNLRKQEVLLRECTKQHIIASEKLTKLLNETNK